MGPIGLTTPLSPNAQAEAREGMKIGNMIKNQMAKGGIKAFAKNTAAAKKRWKGLGGKFIKRTKEELEEDALNPDDLPIYLQQLVLELNAQKLAKAKRAEQAKLDALEITKQKAAEDRKQIHEERIAQGLDPITGLPQK